MSDERSFSEGSWAGETLQLNEAQVERIAGLSKPHRAWQGEDDRGRQVVYFEDGSGTSKSFSISRVITVDQQKVRIEESGETVDSVKVTCHDAQLARVFFGFMNQVRDRISQGVDAMRVITDSASEWRSLLQLATSEISEPAAAGLYGELRFLESAIDEQGASALESWQRSEQDVHDFIAEDARVEVKTSAFQNRAAVTVHGLKQLEPPAGATLTLAVAEVQRHGGETIDQVVERIRSMGVDHEAFLEKLHGAKFVPGMPGAADHTFSLLGWRFWEITPDSPVLRRSSLPQATADAIGGLSYTLDLGALGAARAEFDFARIGTAHN